MNFIKGDRFKVKKERQRTEKDGRLKMVHAASKGGGYVEDTDGSFWPTSWIKPFVPSPSMDSIS